MGKALHAPYALSTLDRVALVAPRDLTPSSEARVPIEDPLTGTLIRKIRETCPFELVPGHVAGTRAFVEKTKAWFDGDRNAARPEVGFEALKSNVAADAYLIVWVNRSSRPWIVDESLANVPGNRYALELTAVLLHPDGRLYWAVVSRDDVAILPGAPGDTVRAVVERAVELTIDAFLKPPAR